MAMPTFWDLLTRVKDETGTSEAWILKQSEMNHGAFTAWRNRGIPVLPPRRQLLLLAKAMRVDYEFLVQVLLHDAGYLPAERAIKDELAGTRPWWTNRSDPVRKADRHILSVADDSMVDLVAADEQEQSISGEQEESETP